MREHSTLFEMRDSVIASRTRIRSCTFGGRAIAEGVAEVIPVVVRIRTREDREGRI